MPKYYVEWPVEKVRSITVEADSEEEALERAMDPALLSDEEILTMYESSSGIVHIYYDKETEALQITGRGRVERGVSSYGVKGYLTQWSQRIPLPIDETGLPSE